MNWEAIGAVGEVLGAIGVIASLFYLGIQIRRNSASVEASTSQAVSDATQARLLVAAQSPELADALAGILRGDTDLSDSQLNQLGFFSRATFRGIQNSFFQHRSGMISDEAWQGYESLLRIHLRAGVVHDWWLVEGITYDKAFRDHVERIAAEDPAA
jgi:hypothetical protein